MDMYVRVVSQTFIPQVLLTISLREPSYILEYD